VPKRHPDQAILRTLWEQSAASRKLIDAPTFRDAHKDWKLGLDRLCDARFIALEGDDYRLTALGLLRVDDPRARATVVLGNAVGAELRAHFADAATRRQSLKIHDLARQLRVDAGDLAFALEHLRDALIAWCDGIDIPFKDPDAGLRPAARIMDSSTVEQVAAQLETWAEEMAEAAKRRTSPQDVIQVAAPNGAARRTIHSDKALGSSGTAGSTSSLEGEPPEIVQGLIWIFRPTTWRKHPVSASVTVMVLLALLVELLPHFPEHARHSERAAPPPASNASPETERKAAEARGLLQYDESQLIPDVRSLRNHAAGAVSPRVLVTRFNIASDKLPVYPVVRDSRTAQLSPERGELLASLVAEGFPFDSPNTDPLRASSADLTPLPQNPTGEHAPLKLGHIDLSGSDAAAAGFRGYDLTGSNLSNAQLPGAAAFERSVLRYIPEKTSNSFSGVIETVSVNLEGAQVPDPGWLRAVEGVVGVRSFGATAWRVVPETGHWVVRAHPDIPFRHAESTLASQANRARWACGWVRRGEAYQNDQEKYCAAETRGFCGQYSDLLRRPTLTAQERGSLFVLAIELARQAWMREIDRRDFRKVGSLELNNRLRQQLMSLEDCVNTASLNGQLDVDVSLLRLEFANFAQRDLTRLRWNLARVEGYFQGARLQPASEFASAQWIVARTEDATTTGWENAAVPADDWAYQVCMARASPRPKNEPFAEPFFPYSRVMVKASQEGYWLQAVESPSGAAWDGPADGSPQARQQFCSAYAPQAKGGL
jgi:hypothetical protein